MKALRWYMSTCSVSKVPLALKLICLKRVCAILLAGEVITPTLFARAVRLAFSPH